MTYEERHWLRHAISEATRRNLGSFDSLETRYRHLDNHVERQCCPVDYIDDSKVYISWTRGSLLRAIEDWAKAHNGEPPRMAEWKYATRGYRYPHSSTVVKAFGSWNAALTQAGLPAHRSDTVAGSAMLRCTRCGEDKPDRAFSLSRKERHRRGRRYWCRICDSADARIRRLVAA